ncbi:ubiquitin specific peptidase 24 isoform A [Micractinium conductrix]|uniref:Ubiquitin specific peptidase 24 isoform A n=1 Tax=Micractinium conductrix TaxID=554055 RepID=A0A2P6VJH5_9CHLO|nr:ubiquitin specific peptidase 24 isoform A [Micractinium conductrix]|eukprot:PSC74217.1 ubiquitin specific peptidase 24 isoform A [Micractinium conductrix]
MDDDDRASGGSTEAAAGGSVGAAPSDLSDGPPLSDVDDVMEAEEGIVYRPNAGPEEAPLRRRAGDGSTGDLGAQEGFLAVNMHNLHALSYLEQGVALPALRSCLRSANSIYAYMIREAQAETHDTIFLMYSSYFQPLLREMLPRAMHQLLTSDRQAQLCTRECAQDLRHICQEFISVVARFLHLQWTVLQGRELTPTISQRVAEDVAQLLRTLADLFESNHLLRSAAFLSQPPSTAANWRAADGAAWAAPAAAAGQAQRAGSGGGGAEGDPGAAAAAAAEEQPETPTQAVVTAWRAACVDAFGAEHGWDALLGILGQPDRAGDYLWAFLAPLASAAPLIAPDRRQQLAEPAAAVVQMVKAGLAAAPDLSALEGSVPHPERRLAQVLFSTRRIVAAVASPEVAETMVGPLQREHVLRLLRASAFTRQLAGVKQLGQLVGATLVDRVPASLEALTAWLQEQGVVQLVLKSNLHQAQYAEAAQRVLSMLLQHGVLSEDSIAFLWQLTQDETTFEVVKSNAYSMLASLGPHMEPAQLAHLFTRLQHRAAASGVAEATSICSLLVGMAAQDVQARMWNEVLDCLLRIQLQRDAPPEVAASQAVVELCSTYDHVLGQDACSTRAAEVCAAALAGEQSVPAAVVLHSLLTNLFHKPDRLRQLMQHINPGAELLRKTLKHYSAWLGRQRAAAAAAGAPLGPAVARPAPPAGAFSHAAAVDAWMLLLHVLVVKGGFFLLQDQVEAMVQWATTEAVCAYDSEQAWRLVQRLVADGRKELMQEVAAKVQEECLCRLPARFLTRPAWRCFLAYLAALCTKWDTEVREDHVTPSNASITQANYESVQIYLDSCFMNAPNELAAAVSHHAATVVTRCTRNMWQGNVDEWLAMERDHATATVFRLKNTALRGSETGESGSNSCGDDDDEVELAWSAPPAVLPALAELPAEAEPPPRTDEAYFAFTEHPWVAVQHAQRLLRYLSQLVEECQHQRMPHPPAHASSWQGFDISVLVQLPAQQGQKPHKQELLLPSNLPVGELRRTVAAWLSKAPQFLRLIAGGRELDSDRLTLAAARAGQQALMCVTTEKANSYSGRHVVAEQLAGAISSALAEHAPEVYSLALALAQPPPVAAAAMKAPQNHASAWMDAGKAGSGLVAAALQLLQVLPTCGAARLQLGALLALPDGGQQLRELVAPPDGGGAPALQPAVLMYAVQVLCSLLFPQATSAPGGGDGGDDEVEVEEEEEDAAEAAAARQRRLLLSGMLDTLLDLATQQLAARGAEGVDPAVAAATHGALLLLLHRLQQGMDEQQMAAATAAVQAATAAERREQPGAAGEQRQAAAGGGASQQPSEPSAMQVDEGPGAEEEGGSLGAGGRAAGSAAGPSPSVSMGAATTSAQAEAEAEAGPGVRAGSSAGGAPPGDELHAASTALAALHPAIVRYTLRMLCSALACAPHSTPSGAPEAKVAPPLPAAPTVELCRQGLLLVKQLACQSSAAVQVVTGDEAATSEAVVRCMLLYPVTTMGLRQLAAEWLPEFAAAAPAAHRWAFERIVQPLLVAEHAGGDQEQMALCNHFIDTLHFSEFPAARQLLQTLLQRLLAAAARLEPIDGWASVVGALIRRLDCREVGVSSGLVSQLISHCCFPALTALRLRHEGVLATLSARSAVTDAAPTDADADPQPGELQAAALQLAAANAALVVSGVAAEQCIEQARVQGTGPTSAGSASREAAFELLLDLICQDSDCWHAAQEQLSTVVHSAASDVLPLTFGNTPLQNLRGPDHFAGLLNGGATCYMSSVFQQLYMQPTIRKLVLGAPGVPQEEQADSVFHQMQDMFAHLELGIEPWFAPRGFWQAFKDYDGQPVNIREHQDAYEFFTRLQDSVDEHLRAQGCPRAIHAAMGGTWAQLITVVDAPQYRSERDEPFYQISLDVRGKRTLAESLRSFVSKELMDGQNQYECEELGKKVDAEKRTLIKELPHTLALHLKRFEWDYETYQRWKVKDRFDFPWELDLFPYTVEGADEADGREPAVKHPRDHYQYELCGVVVHSGSAFAGHYYSYIKNRQDHEWYCFDDTAVLPWNEEEIEKDCFGGRYVPEGFTHECDRPNSAYMLFYERAGESDADLAARGYDVAAAGTACAVDAATVDPGESPAGQGDATMPAAQGETPTMSAAQQASGEAAPAAAAANGVQPMAVSPAPPEDQQGVAAGAGGGGEQPPAQQQQQQQQQAGAAAAVPGQHHPPFGMPQQLYDALLYGNLRQLGSMQLLSPEYSRFFWQLSIAVQEASGTSTARKAPKREPTSSPGGMELSGASGSASGGCVVGDCPLAALTSRRGGDMQAVIAEVAVLCLDYFLRVALRGGQELKKEVVGTTGRKGTTGMAHNVLDAARKVPAAAAALLLHMADGPAGQAASALLVQHSVASVREIVATLIRESVDCLARQERRTDEAVHALRAVTDHLCSSAVPLAIDVADCWRTYELLTVLVRIGSPKYPWRRALLDPHLSLLLALVRRVADFWSGVEAEDRSQDSPGYYALILLSYLLRRFSPELPHAQQLSRRKPQRAAPQPAPERPPRNPHCLDGVDLVPMPLDVVEWLYGDPFFLRKLMMPGCVRNTSTLRLFLFLQHDNTHDAQLWHRTMLDHVLIDCADWRDLAAEVLVLSQLMVQRDGLQAERVSTLLLGAPEGGPGPGLLQEMTNARRGVGCQHLLLYLALTVLHEVPEELALSVLENQDRWLHWASEFINRRWTKQKQSEGDSTVPPDSPTADDLATEGQLDPRVMSPGVMWRQLSGLQQLANAERAPGGAAGSGTSSGSGSGSSDSGDEGAPRVGALGTRGAALADLRPSAGEPRGAGGAGAGAGLQAGLVQYGDDAEVGDDASRGAGAGSRSQQPGGGCRGAPGAQRGGSAGSAGFVRAGHAQQEELPLQQHISAGFGGGVEEQEEEVIEIHSDQD